MKSIKEISNELVRETMKQDEQALIAFISKHGVDDRKGVTKILESAKKRLTRLQKENLRIERLKQFDSSFGDYEHICGIDEVGRGPLAGPVVTCAVIMSKNSRIKGINDSKKVSLAKREELYEKIKGEAISYSFGVMGADVIDEINILNATKKAMKQSVENLSISPDLVLVDAVKIDDIDYKQQSIIKGDEKSYVIGCASILAKVYRDNMMVEYSKEYAGYSFEKNKGYGTREHYEGIERFGPCDIHRRTFL